MYEMWDFQQGNMWDVEESWKMVCFSCLFLHDSFELIVGKMLALLVHFTVFFFFNRDTFLET